MGLVDAFTLDAPYRAYFNSNDHMSPHFEVLKRGEWCIRVSIRSSTRKRGLRYTAKWARKPGRGPAAGPTADEEAMLLALVIRHRRRLLGEFRRKVRLAE